MSTVHNHSITLPLEAKHAHVSDCRTLLLLTVWGSFFHNGHLNHLLESLDSIQRLLTVFTLLLLILHPHFYVEQLQDLPEVVLQAMCTDALPVAIGLQEGQIEGLSPLLLPLVLCNIRREGLVGW